MSASAPAPDDAAVQALLAEVSEALLAEYPENASALGLDKAVPVVQGCAIRRAPVSNRATSFYRTDCDATGKVVLIP